MRKLVAGDVPTRLLDPPRRWPVGSRRWRFVDTRPSTASSSPGRFLSGSKEPEQARSYSSMKTSKLVARGRPVARGLVAALGDPPALVPMQRCSARVTPGTSAAALTTSTASRSRRSTGLPSELHTVLAPRRAPPSWTQAGVTEPRRRTPARDEPRAWRRVLSARSLPPGDARAGGRAPGLLSLVHSGRLTLDLARPQGEQPRLSAVRQCEWVPGGLRCGPCGFDF